jgi:hypothetical protein
MPGGHLCQGPSAGGTLDTVDLHHKTCLNTGTVCTLPTARRRGRWAGRPLCALGGARPGGVPRQRVRLECVPRESPAARRLRPLDRDPCQPAGRSRCAAGPAAAGSASRRQQHRRCPRGVTTAAAATARPPATRTHTGQRSACARLARLAATGPLPLLCSAAAAAATQRAGLQRARRGAHHPALAGARAGLRFSACRARGQAGGAGGCRAGASSRWAAAARGPPAAGGQSRRSAAPAAGARVGRRRGGRAHGGRCAAAGALRWAGGVLAPGPGAPRRGSCERRLCCCCLPGTEQRSASAGLSGAHPSRTACQAPELALLGWAVAQCEGHINVL